MEGWLSKCHRVPSGSAFSAARHITSLRIRSPGEYVLTGLREMYLLTIEAGGHKARPYVGLGTL